MTQPSTDQPSPALTPEDIKDLRRRRMKPSHVQDQVALLRRGSPRLGVVRPCRIGDGVRRIAEEEGERLAALYEPARKAGRARQPATQPALTVPAAPRTT